MRTSRHTTREVLSDKRGLSTSITETLAAMGLKGVIMAVSGGVLVTLLVFWAVNAASANTSSGFQTADLGFEKSVSASNVVVGVDADTVGLLKDLPGDKCEVETWQASSADGVASLVVDTKTVDGVCTPTTPLHAAGSGETSRTLLVDIEAPAFAYKNLGGREITYSDSGVPALATGVKPDDVRLDDWDDTRPYKVALSLETKDEDADVTTKKAVLSGFTNVVNVTAAEDDLRYVPSPSEDPIPGPLRITGVQRSDTAGDVVGGVREGISVTFAGGVCPPGPDGPIPTKLNVSYTQQSPTAGTPVNTVVSAVLTGSDTTVHLGQVPNGSSGAVEASATCMEGGAAETASSGFTQDVPATVLTAKQNAGAAEKHDLSWTQVSSLPTSFQVFWTVGPMDKGLLVTTDKLAHQAVNTVGENYGYKSTYTIVATVDTVKSPPTSASITNTVPAPGATTVTSSATGATWTAVSCVPGTTPQYATRTHQQTGTSTAVNWTALSAWGTGRTLAGVTTPDYGRTIAEVQTRCIATLSGVASTVPTPGNDAFYQPEALGVSAARSATTGTVFQGVREGMTATTTGARCYNGTPSKVDLIWTPAAPAGQSNVTNGRTFVPTGAAQAVELNNVKNGAQGALSGTVTCTAGKSGTASKSATFNQSLPATVPNVVQNAANEKHDISWGAVSSLPTSFEVRRTVGATTDALLTTTTALAYQASSAVGSNYGYTSTYKVTGVVGAVKSTGNGTINNPVPKPGASTVTSSATGATWTAVSCPTGTTPQYASRYYQQAGTNTAVNWTALSAWGTGRTLAGVNTPAYGRTIAEAQARCLATLSGVASAGVADNDSFYQPEAINVSAGRSTTTGTVLQSVREGMTAWHSGARCYNGSSVKIDMSWQPSNPSGQNNVNNSRTIVPTGAGQSVELANVYNGASGSLVGTATCTAGKSGSATKSAAFTQTLPTPGLSISQTSAHQHTLTWNKVSSLATSFVVKWSSTNKLSGTVGTTAALTLTATQATGSTYGQTSTYSVTPTVGSQTNSSQNTAFTAWPAAAKASALSANTSNATSNYSSRTLSWTNGAACPAGTTKQVRSNVNQKWNWDGLGIWKDYELSSWTANDTSNNSTTAIDQGYPYQFAVDTKCVSAYSESAVASAQSGDQWNGWATPPAPGYYARTTWQKTEQPAGSIYDICRNHGTTTCKTYPGKGDSITLHYNTVCPGGSTLGPSRIESASWDNGFFNAAIHEGDGWETGRTDQFVKYYSARYNCKTIPWGNLSPGSPWSGNQDVMVRAR